MRCVRIHRKGIVEQQVEEGRPGVVGWEKNDQGKLGPRMADLGPLLDPVKFVLLACLSWAEGVLKSSISLAQTRGSSCRS